MRSYNKIINYQRSLNYFGVIRIVQEFVVLFVVIVADVVDAIKSYDVVSTIVKSQPITIWIRR